MSDPRIWGTDLWKTLHRFSLSYPQTPSREHKRDARAFFNAVRTLLPCPGCRVHYGRYFDKTFKSSGAVDNRENLVKWVHALHEAVNKRLGKPTGAVRVVDVARLYNSFPKRYVSLDGKKLLRVPRFTTVNDDYGKCDEEEESLEKPNDLDAASRMSVDFDDASVASSALSIGTTSESSNDAHSTNDDASSAANQWPTWLMAATIGALATVVIGMAVACAVRYVKRRSEAQVLANTRGKKGARKRRTQSETRDSFSASREMTPTLASSMSSSVGSYNGSSEFSASDE